MEWNTEQAQVVAEIHRLIQEYHDLRKGELEADYKVFTNCLFDNGVITEQVRDAIYASIDAQLL